MALKNSLGIGTRDSTATELYVTRVDGAFGQISLIVQSLIFISLDPPSTDLITKVISGKMYYIILHSSVVVNEP